MDRSSDPPAENSPQDRISPSSDLGRWAENEAARFLTEQGCEVIARNFGGRHGEIDLVVRDGACLVFVEVKARSSIGYGKPAHAVGWRKQQRLRRTALEFLDSHRPGTGDLRFDVVAIVVVEGQVDPIVEHFRAAF